MASTEVILVGGVGQLYLGDLDVGRHAAERLAAEDLGADVIVEDLYYGAITVAHQLRELVPSALVLVGGAERGRAPGTVTCRHITGLHLSPEELQGAVHDAGTGYVALELVVEVAWALGVLPQPTVVVEIEPAHVDPAEHLTPEATRGLGQALVLVREEIARLRRELPTA